MTLEQAKKELFGLAKKFVGRPQVAIGFFREWRKNNPSHLMSVEYVWKTCFGVSFIDQKTSSLEDAK